MDSSAAGFTQPQAFGVDLHSVAAEVPPLDLHSVAAEVPPLDGRSGDTAGGDTAAAAKAVWSEPEKGSMAVLGISIWPSLSESKQVSRKSSSSSSGSQIRLSDDSISDNVSVASSQNWNNGNPIPARNHVAHTHQNFSRNAGTRTNRGPAPPLPRPVSSQMPGIRESFPQTGPHGGGLQHRSYANIRKKHYGGNQRFNNDRVELHRRNNVNIHVQEQRGLNDGRQRSTGIGLQPPVPQGVNDWRQMNTGFGLQPPPVPQGVNNWRQRNTGIGLQPPVPQGVNDGRQRNTSIGLQPPPVPQGVNDWRQRNTGIGLQPPVLQGVPPFFRPIAPFFRPAMPVLDPFIPHDPRFMPSMAYAAAPPTPPLNYTATPPPLPPLNYAATATPPTGIVPFGTYPTWSPISLPMLNAQRMQVLNQVEYYFSPENLAKTSHLRLNMDKEGWVSVSLIASFRRIKEFTPNMFDDRQRQEFVLDTVSSSAVVEVRDGKIRKRNDWSKWIIDPSCLNNSGPQSSTTPSIDTLTTHMQGLALEVTDSRTTSGSPATQLPFVGVLTGVESGQVKD